STTIPSRLHHHRLLDKIGYPSKYKRRGEDGAIRKSRLVREDLGKLRREVERRKTRPRSRSWERNPEMLRELDFEKGIFEYAF
ncbi:hypothetical protein ISN44_As12g032500, partial [Arabidopsis suecica]